MPFRAIFFLWKLFSNGARMLGEPDPQKKICPQESLSLFLGRSRRRRARRCGIPFFSRGWKTAPFERRAREERTQKLQEQDRATIEQMGGKECHPNFYATPER